MPQFLSLKILTTYQLTMEETKQIPTQENVTLIKEKKKKVQKVIKLFFALSLTLIMLILTIFVLQIFETQNRNPETYFSKQIKGRHQDCN